MHERPLILGIESSCDDTAAAVVDGQGRVVASVVSSQLAAHRPYGGVVPEIASREHLTNWPAVSEELFRQSGLTWGEIDSVAATCGPGLVGSLLVGLSLGKALAFGLGRTFHAIHHLEAHLYSPFLHPTGEAASALPEHFVGLVVSGGHTSLYQVAAPTPVDGAEAGAIQVETLAETRDDAMGEVFDKVGRRLGLPYPQGPLVDRLADLGTPGRFRLPVPNCSDQSLDFSYSGLKSQTLSEIERLWRTGVSCELAQVDADTGEGAAAEVLDLLADFRQAAVEQIVQRLDRLRRSGRFSGGQRRILAVSGGVAANRLLRRRLATWADEQDVELRLVPLVFSGDNAAMIAHAALLRQRRGLFDDPLTAEATSRLPVGEG